MLRVRKGTGSALPFGAQFDGIRGSGKSLSSVAVTGTSRRSPSGWSPGWGLEALLRLGLPQWISQAPLKTGKRGPGHPQGTAWSKQERLAVAPWGRSWKHVRRGVDFKAELCSNWPFWQQGLREWVGGW